MPLPEEGAELELRLRRIEDTLATKAVANPEAPADPDPPATTVVDPPPISGLVLVSGLSKVSVRWNPSTIQDLKFYELVIADNEDFANPTTVRLTQTFYTYNEAEVNREYWFKVRAVNISDVVGEFSGRLSSVTGLVTTDDIDPKAISGTGTARTFKVVPFPGTPGVPIPRVEFELHFASLSTPPLPGSRVQIWWVGHFDLTLTNPAGNNFHLYRGRFADGQRLLTVHDSVGGLPTDTGTTYYIMWSDETPTQETVYSITMDTRQLGFPAGFGFGFPNILSSLFLLELKR